MLLVPLVRVELHSLGLGSGPPPLGLGSGSGSGSGLATYTLISTMHKYQRFSVNSAAAVP